MICYSCSSGEATPTNNLTSWVFDDFFPSKAASGVTDSCAQTVEVSQNPNTRAFSLVKQMVGSSLNP